MNETTLSREQIITLLKTSIEFGVDEAFCEKPINRFEAQTTTAVSSLPKDQDSNPENLNLSTEIELIKGDSASTKTILAVEQANDCKTVCEVTEAIKNFPHFIKNNQIETKDFYLGVIDPLILVFKEPEIYNIQSHDDVSAFDKSLLFNRIIGVINKVVGDQKRSACALVESFPIHFDSKEENKAFNEGLLQPFLLRYVTVSKPKVVICQGDFWFSKKSNEFQKYNDFFKDIFIAEFPSIDVLGRAPKRKKEVWKKILELKRFLIDKE